MKGLDNMANDTKRIIIGKPYLDQVGGVKPAVVLLFKLIIRTHNYFGSKLIVTFQSI